MEEVQSKQGLKKGWEENNEILLHQGLPYMQEIIRIELISCYQNDLQEGPFWTKKIRELIAQKYYWLSLCCNVEDYMKDCDVYLALRIVRHKLLGDLQLLPIPSHW